MEKQDKAFSIATDMVKLLITLSTGVITFTVTFSKELFGDLSHINFMWLLITSWGLLTFSMFLGFLTLGTMVGTLSKGEDNTHEHSSDESGNSENPRTSITTPPNTVYSSNIRKFCLVQILFFLAGLICVFILGYINLPNKEKKIDGENANLRVLKISTYKMIDSLKIDTLSCPEKR